MDCCAYLLVPFLSDTRSSSIMWGCKHFDEDVNGIDLRSHFNPTESCDRTVLCNYLGKEYKLRDCQVWSCSDARVGWAKLAAHLCLCISLKSIKPKRFEAEFILREKRETVRLRRVSLVAPLRRHRGRLP